MGAVIPGSTIILALSALVPGGELQLGPVLAAAISGALLGDGIGVLDRPSRPAQHPERLAAVELSARWSPRARRSFTAGARWRYSSRASCRRSAPSCRSRRARSACRRCAFTPSTSRRSCSGRPPMCCRACWRYRRCTHMPAFRITPGSASTLDPGGDRRRAGRRNRCLDHPPPARPSVMTCAKPGCGPAPDRCSARGGGSARHGAIVRWHARSSRRYAPSQTAPVHGRAAGPACAPAPPAHSRY